jgi:hypothetical protein
MYHSVVIRAALYPMRICFCLQTPSVSSSRDRVITPERPCRSISHRTKLAHPRSLVIIMQLFLRANAVHRVPLPATISKVVLSCWPTPRTQAATHSHTLTSRTAYDLNMCDVCAVYGRHTGKAYRRFSSDKSNFVEWLMGYQKELDNIRRLL